jgi:hypothetical protein
MAARFLSGVFVAEKGERLLVAVLAFSVKEWVRMAACRSYWHYFRAEQLKEGKWEQFRVGEKEGCPLEVEWLARD